MNRPPSPVFYSHNEGITTAKEKTFPPRKGCSVCFLLSLLSFKDLLLAPG